TYFDWRKFEYYGSLNLLKGGIALADMVTTVSPTYATEIQHPDYGYGLDPLLIERRDRVVGILNGVDIDDWHPSKDNALPVTYGPQDFESGKATCKKALQAEMGLEQNPDLMLIGMI